MTCGVFGSSSVTVHLLRGAAAALLLVWALTNADHAALAIAALAGAVFCMRGCPMCWAVGLVETLVSSRAVELSP